ncbi:MAG: hypothetical protein HOO96_15815 [Polyangiaceae bacterium]|nr:hypothetical protein [Polyangiaceae bacterium]
MLGRVHTSTNRVWLEQLLAFAAPILAMWLSTKFPSYLEDWRLHIPAAAAVALCWLPALARTRSTRVGEVRIDGEHLVVPGALGARRIPLRRVRGAQFTPRANGALEGTLVIRVASTAAGRTVMAVEVDDAEGAQALVAELETRCGLGAPMCIPVDNVAGVVLAVRGLIALSVVAVYTVGCVGVSYLWPVLGIVLSYLAVVVVHLTRMRLMIPLRPQAGLAGLLAPFPAAMRALLRAIALRDPSAVAGARCTASLLASGEAIGQALARLRGELAGETGAYRRAGEGLRELLDTALRQSDTPMAERALALRLSGGGDMATVQRRLDEMRLPTAVRGDLEAVALAESDDRATKLLLRVPPRASIQATLLHPDLHP